MMIDSMRNAIQTAAIPRMLVMGVGSSGAKVVIGMRSANPQVDAAVIDTDARTLEALPAECAIHIGAAVTRNFSAGGDVELGRQAIEKDSFRIRKRLHKVDLLVIIAGLGRGTGSGAVPVIARIARESGVLTLAIVSTPFSFEGKQIVRIAEEVLQRIRCHADAIIQIPNKQLIEPADAPLSVEQAFSLSHHTMMNGITTLQRMLSHDGICRLDFASIQVMLRNCDGFCHFAVTETSGVSRAEEASKNILNHPLLHKGRLLETAKGAIIGLAGGHDLKLSEMETVMRKFQAKLPEDTWLNFGVVVDSGLRDRLAVIILAAESWKEPLLDGSSRKGVSSFNPADTGQTELLLDNAGKGRFAYMEPAIHNNQNLDVPAYIRRNIKLPH